MSPSKATSTIYWDSCIFIAWIKDEKRPAGEMDGVYECVDRVQAGTIRLITSVFTRTEVFESDLPAHVRSQYAALLNDVAGHAIRVCKPEVTQFRLRF